jgi:hypothetical protein
MNLFALRPRSKATLFAPSRLPPQLATTKSLHRQADKARHLTRKIIWVRKVK